MSEIRRIGTSTPESHHFAADDISQAFQAAQEVQQAGPIRVEAPMKEGDPYRTFLSPEQSVCWYLNDMLDSLQDDGSNNNGIVARLRAYTPVNGTYLPVSSEVSSQSLQALMATAKIVKESQTTYIGHGSYNTSLAAAGMKHNPKVAEAAGSSPDEIFDFIISQSKHAVVVGDEDFYKSAGSGEGLSLLPPEQDEVTEAIRITLVALLYDGAAEKVVARVLDPATVEAIAQGSHSIIGWLGLDSEGCLTVAGTAALASHDGNRLPCLTIDTLARPRQNNEYALAAMRNNRLAGFLLYIAGDYPRPHQADAAYPYGSDDRTFVATGVPADKQQADDEAAICSAELIAESETGQPTAELDMTDLLLLQETAEGEELVHPIVDSADDNLPPDFNDTPKLTFVRPQDYQRR